VRGDYDAQAQRYTLSISQSCPATPGQAEKAPFHIPLKVALLGEAGQLPLQLKGQPQDTETADNTEMVLDVTEAKQQFVFENVIELPVPSLLRGFSAPVKLSMNYQRADLLRIMQSDSDGFCRWDASQQLGLAEIRNALAAQAAGKAAEVAQDYLDACRQLLEDAQLDPAMVALMLQLPSEAYLAELISPVDVHAIHHAREALRKGIATALVEPLQAAYRRCASDEDYRPSAEQIARRSLKNAALSYLMYTSYGPEVAREQFETSRNMTDRSAALNAIVNSDMPYKSEALQRFYQDWQHEPLVINQWFQVQAMCRLPGTLERVVELMSHPAYDAANPNKVRALVGAFCGQNAVNFHSEDGAGYAFLADRVIELNQRNPQIASRLLGPLSKWRKYTPDVQQRMRGQLERILAEPELSSDVYEVVSKSLKD
jgi:aminopeptidase N